MRLGFFASAGPLPMKGNAMYATVKATVQSVRPLEPRPPRPGQTGPVKIQCEVTAIVDGPRGAELKKFKAPFADMTDLMAAAVEKAEVTLDIDVNEWEVEGKKGVTYMVREDSK